MKSVWTLKIVDPNMMRTQVNPDGIRTVFIECADEMPVAHELDSVLANYHPRAFVQEMKLHHYKSERMQ